MWYSMRSSVCSDKGGVSASCLSGGQMPSAFLVQPPVGSSLLGGGGGGRLPKNFFF